MWVKEQADLVIDLIHSYDFITKHDSIGFHRNVVMYANLSGLLIAEPKRMTEGR